MTEDQYTPVDSALPDVDPLTTLPYYGRFVALVDRTLAEFPDRVRAFVRMDIDGFVEFDKQRGQRAGDQLLREIGECVAHHIRTDDTATHAGRGEFVLFLDDVDPDTAHVAVERIRSSMHDLHSGAVRLSGGIAVHDNALAASDTLEAATLALRNAKLRGGNRVEIVAATPASQHCLF